MASRIEWTQETWNPVTGCTKVSPGCEHCYAERFSERFRGVKGHPYETGFDLTLRPERLDQPFKWKKPRRVFVNSMSDLFHENVPDKFIDLVFAVMTMAQRHTFQVLTKRPQRMQEYIHGKIDHDWSGWLPMNVWLGVSAEDQKRTDERIPPLLETPAAVRFVSAEPLLGPIDFGAAMDQIDWVIVGGESGPGARPMNPDWVRSIRDQCSSFCTPFFFKQWGGRTPKANGNTLDGRQWQEYPVTDSGMTAGPLPALTNPRIAPEHPESEDDK